MKDGALLLDGIDDYISAGNILDPAAGPFSVFAWVKGGAPNQVIISQENGVNWLMADATNGTLMTELKYLSRKSKPLASQLSLPMATGTRWVSLGMAQSHALRRRD